MDLVLIMVQMPLCGRQWEPAKHRCSQLQKPSAGPASKSFNPIFDSLKQATRWDVNASRAKGQEGQWCSSTPPRDKKFATRMSLRTANMMRSTIALLNSTPPPGPKIFVIRPTNGHTSI